MPWLLFHSDANGHNPAFPVNEARPAQHVSMPPPKEKRHCRYNGLLHDGCAEGESFA
jgi:hypothetical protein